MTDAKEDPLSKRKCQTVTGVTQPLPLEKMQAYQLEISDWELLAEAQPSLQQTFVFRDFNEAMGFVQRVVLLAEKENHHPNIDIRYNMVKLILYTHKISGLSENDFILAAKISELVK